VTVLKPEIRAQIDNACLAVEELPGLFCRCPVRQTKEIGVTLAPVIVVRGLKHALEAPAQ